MGDPLLDLLAELDWCPACYGHPWEPGDPDLCERHAADGEQELEADRDGR